MLWGCRNVLHSSPLKIMCMYYRVRVGKDSGCQCFTAKNYVFLQEQLMDVLCYWFNFWCGKSCNRYWSNCMQVFLFLVEYVRKSLELLLEIILLGQDVEAKLSFIFYGCILICPKNWQFRVLITSAGLKIASFHSVAMISSVCEYVS